MTDKKEPIKVVFEPGCFDQFDGTQEELDDFVKEITSMFENKTADEIKALSTPLNVDDLPAEVLAQLAEHLFEEDELKDLEKMGMPRKRNLQ